MRFYGRVDELRLMEHLFQNSPSFLVITGRRRIGKTTLVREFIHPYSSLYFFVDNHKKIEQIIDEYSKILSERFDLPPYFSLRNSNDLFSFLFQIKEPIIIIFDEFQRFSHIYPPFFSELQHAWDSRPADSRVFLIVTGSSIGMIQHIFLSGGAPLFKRADTLITLQPFPVNEIFPMLDELTHLPLEEKIKIYYLFGGIIHYYYLFNKFSCTNFSEILEKIIFNRFGPLRREISDILVEEFGSEHSSYHAIISALASGKTSMKEIGDRAGITVTSLSPYLDNLISLLGIVAYKVPAGDEKGRSRLGRYYLTDPFFRFYARFVYPYMSRFEVGDYSYVIEKVHEGWDSHAGRCFEDLVREILTPELIREYESVGSWWNRKGDEIDIVASGPNGTIAIECKNRILSEEQSREILKKALNKGELIKNLKRPLVAGIAALGVQGKEGLRKDGFRVWDIEEIAAVLQVQHSDL